MICNTMSRRAARNWGIAVGAVALLNIVDVLPDWTTIAAILTLPFFAAIHANRSGGDAR